MTGRPTTAKKSARQGAATKTAAKAKKQTATRTAKSPAAKRAPVGVDAKVTARSKAVKRAPAAKATAKAASAKTTAKTTARAAKAKATTTKAATPPGRKPGPAKSGPVIDVAARAAAAAAGGGPRFWLMKSEPEAYSIDDLQRQGVTPWEGVRNYRARNHMRDDMRVGDAVLFYHSSTTPPGVVGLARVASAPYPDASALDPANAAYDPGPQPDAPRWILVDVAFVEKFAAGLSLDQMREDPALAGMLVTQTGQRLSVQPVERAHFEHVVRRVASTRARELLGASPSA